MKLVVYGADTLKSDIILAYRAAKGAYNKPVGTTTTVHFEDGERFKVRTNKESVSVQRLK